MSKQTTHAFEQALAAEIERVRAKRERWTGYAQDVGPRSNYAVALQLMQLAIDEGVEAIASGDAERMSAAHEELREYDDHD